MSVPAKLPTPTEGTATTIDRIQVNWTELTTMEETGGKFEILSYNLQISWIQDTWIEVVGETTPFTDLTYTESNLATGTDYKVKIRAQNSFGWGPFSDEITIRADEVPA